MNAVDVVNQHGSEITGLQGIVIWLFLGFVFLTGAWCLYVLIKMGVACGLAFCELLGLMASAEEEEDDAGVLALPTPEEIRANPDRILELYDCCPKCGDTALEALTWKSIGSEEITVGCWGCGWMIYPSEKFDLPLKRRLS